MAAVRATLTEVLTDESFDVMIDRAAIWTAGVQQGIDSSGLPWHVTRLGCRAEYAFSADPPRHGAQAAAVDDFTLQQYLHLAALNDGLLLTPFHNMALMCPATSEEDVARHTRSFRRTIESLTGA
jgi:glutamate-1-semialdehyde aminotransferase